MRKPLSGAVLLVLIFTGLAWAANYTVSTNAAQDAKITRMRVYANANNKLGAPFANDTAFVDFQCKQKFADLYRDIQTQPDDVFEAAWDSASQGTRDGICATLGVSAGCKP